LRLSFAQKFAKLLSAEIIIPRPLDNRFSYQIPEGMPVEVGSRVMVDFGKQKIITGIVASIEQKTSQKAILELLGDQPVVSERQIAFWIWLARYYLCSEGEVMAAALPSGLKLSSESFLEINPDFQEFQIFNEPELALWKSLNASRSLSYAHALELARGVLGEIEQTLWGDELRTAPNSQALRVLKSMLDKNALLIFDKVKEKYQPKTVSKIRLSPSYLEPQALNEAFGSLIKTPEQEQLLLHYLSLTQAHITSANNQAGVAKRVLLGANQHEKALAFLLKKGVFESFKAIEPRFATAQVSHPKNIALNPKQKEAFVQIVKGFETKAVVLLHGITGSGKTEVYIELADRFLLEGKQVLILVPEIALTVQTVARFEEVFGGKLGVYHSKFSDKERVEIWQGVLSKRFSIVIGVRSSIFLPFNELGLVIVDEEHDSSYKQADPAPRYQARDAAVVLAWLQGAKVLLGSATPSLESWYNAQSGRYGFVQLLERYSTSQSPDFVFVDMKQARKSKAVRGDFSTLLLDELVATKAQNRQSILFLNKRGYAPQIQCLDCGEIPQCSRCSVSLTYHLASQELRCHYCGQHQTLQNQCNRCGSTRLRTIGVGTQKVEDDLKLFAPELEVIRMDLDSTKGNRAFERIVREFGSGKVDVLAGTQMVTKGLDFGAVDLVGVLDADKLLYFPDFRNHERAFQLMLQVAGRTGRRSQKGKVLIQTTQPQHFVLQCVANQDFETFYRHELVERQKFGYPPYSRLIVLTIKAQDQKICQKAAENLALQLKSSLHPDWVLDPAIPRIERIKDLYHRDIFIRLPKSNSLESQKALIKATCKHFIKAKDFGKISLKIDVDAY
jgi:primosomal protein N' (replication factor Y)